jgi:hypothetical protein
VGGGGGCSLSDKASVARIVKGGIEYVMASPSTRMVFLPRALTDFTKKLSKEDANALVAWFQDNQPAPNAGYDRKPFYEYFNTLRKLVELDPICEFGPRSVSPAPAAASPTARHVRARLAVDAARHGRMKLGQLGMPAMYWWWLCELL